MKSRGQIIEISEVTDITIGESSLAHDGYRIELDTGIVIQLLIENYQSCCENWGYLYTPDIIQAFLFADVYSWDNTYTPIAREAVGMAAYYDRETSDEDVTVIAQFITFHTSVGELTFAVYNEHNGYYSHGAKLVINDKVVKEWNL